MLKPINLKTEKIPQMQTIHRLCLLLLWAPCALCAEDLESGLAKLADNLAAGISKASIHKVSVLDFTDLQGNNSELGRYIAEQLSISLVNSSKGFAVMNRANLKTILDEHKLTASGLVNPENAQKLGHIAGVDAIVMGTMTPFGETLTLTAQILSTETAQVLGGSTIKIAHSKEIDELLAPKTAPKTLGDGPGRTSGGTKDFDASNSTSAFENITVEILSFRFTDTPSALVTLRIVNCNKKNIVAFGLNSRGGGMNQQGFGAFLVDEHGKVFHLYSATGIGAPKARHYSGEAFGEMRDELKLRQGANLDYFLAKMNELAVGQSAVITLSFDTKGKVVGEIFRLHSEIIVAEILRSSLPRLALNNVLLEGIRSKQ